MIRIRSRATRSRTGTMKRWAISLILIGLAIPAYPQQWDEIAQRWPNGNPRMVNVLDGNGTDVVVVKRTAYFESGQKEMEVELKDGLPHGHFIRYYENGIKQMEGDMKEGKLHGHQTVWYEDGHKKGEGEYQYDVQMPGWRYWGGKETLMATE